MYRKALTGTLAKAPPKVELHEIRPVVAPSPQYLHATSAMKVAESLAGEKSYPMLKGLMRLRTFAENIWVADGSPVNSIGPWKHATRMIVIRLTDGSLWVNSPISAFDDDILALQELGPVRYLVAPIRFHVWRLKKWMKLFPKAEIWGPPGSGKSLEKSLEKITFDGVLGDAPPAAWSRDLDQMVFRCSPAGDEAEFLHLPSRTLIVSDCIQEPRSPVSYLTRPLVRLSLTRRAAGRRSRAGLLSWNFDGLIVAHGPCVQEGARAYVERALGWL